MNNDRRIFLDGSTAPRKPLPAPLTEGAMKAAMEDWLTALPKPAVKEFFGVAKKFFNPKDKKKADAKNLEILKKYKIKPLINDPSHRESLNALSCCLDMLRESVKVDGDQLNELQTHEREQMQMKELQRLQTIARAKAKAWHPKSSNSEEQEGVFDAAVDKLSAEVRDAENERRREKVIDKDGKYMKKPSAALLKQLAPQREAQLKRDASEGEWMGTAQFSRDSSKASTIIDEIKKGLSRAKSSKKEEVTTEAYNPYDMTGPVWDAIFAFQEAEKAGQKNLKGFIARIAILAKFMKLTDHVKILKLLDQICDIEGGKGDDKLREYSRAWYTQIVNMFQTKYPKESEKAWGGGASGFPQRPKQ